MVTDLPTFGLSQKRRDLLATVHRCGEPNHHKPRAKLAWRACIVILVFICPTGRWKPVDSLFTRLLAHRGASIGLVDWKSYAYCQYVTTEEYLCNSVMIFESLARLDSQADRLLLYPEQWSIETNTTTGRLLCEARDLYNVKLQPIAVQTLKGDFTWADSFTKLLAFNQTQYRRVLSLDSDSTILQHMDSLFELPSTALAAPRAYWLSQSSELVLSSQLLLVQPSKLEFYRILEAFRSRIESDFDMEIINNPYNESALVIPHRPYNLLTGEFKSSGHNTSPDTDTLDHSAYLGSREAVWDPDSVIDEAKFVHFSAYPLPKSWIMSTDEQVRDLIPGYRVSESMAETSQQDKDCRERDIWLGLYADFRRRRLEVCGLGAAGGMLS